MKFILETSEFKALSVEGRAFHSSTDNRLVVLKQQSIVILLTNKRKFETKKLKENSAKNVRPCRLQLPEVVKLRLPDRVAREQSKKAPTFTV